MGSFLEEEVENGLEVTKGIGENKDRHANRKERVDEAESSEAHDDGADQDDCPTKYILEHMKVDGLLVEGFAVVSIVSGGKINDHADNGKDNHTVIIDRCGVDEAVDSSVNHQGGAK